jgi:3-oxoacyl-[acyl-carrier protein] reductase
MEVAMLSGKTAIITGGSRGIGREIAINMAKNGANVAIIYSGNEESALETCSMASDFGIKAKSFKCDVSDFEQTKQTTQEIISEFGTVDILVNNAGITKDNLIIRMSEEDFDSVMSINLKGAFNMIKHLYSPFIRKKSGRIINITSVSGLMGNAGQANYSASKAGMIGLTKTVAKELAGKNVTCNAIAPGFIDTDMTESLPEAVKLGATQAIPMKRMGTPQEIAHLAVFLASDSSSYITGEVIRVDGGMCM